MGMDVSELPQAAEARFNLVYTCPSHQHPIGAVLSLPRRLELLSWAQKSGAMIIEDEHDSEFRLVGGPVPPLKALDENNQVIFVGTFNKSLFPSMSISYMVLPENLVDVYYRTRDFSSEHVPLLMQAALAEFMQRGLLSRHVRKMHSVYAKRRQCLLSALKTNFGERATILGDQSGMHVLVRFDTYLPEPDLTQKARSVGVGLLGTSTYYVGGPSHPAEYMLGYADLNESKIEEGIRRLAAIML
jgi:GntR family transcriptional regulator/MocR family aminotransferase